MNRELWIQVLDTAAFVLITPEILSKDRLESIRTYLGGPAWAVRVTLIAIICSVSLAPAIVMIFSDTYKPFAHFRAYAVIGFTLIAALIAVTILNYAKPIILWSIRMTESFVVRGKLFLAGATFFLLARVISAILAWHPAICAHGK